MKTIIKIWTTVVCCAGMLLASCTDEKISDSKQSLMDLIREAETLIVEIEEGTNEGDIAPGSKKVLQTRIDQAYYIMNNTSRDEGYVNARELLEEYTARYQGLQSITETGCYQIYDTYNSRWAEIAVIVDEKTGEILGIHDRTANLTAGYYQSMADEAQRMAESQSSSFNRIITTADMYVDMAGNLRDANGNIISSMQEVKTATDGTRQGIININGTPYEITVNNEKKGISFVIK